MSVYQTSSRDRVIYLADEQTPEHVAQDTFRRRIGTKVLANKECVEDEASIAVVVE